MLTLRIEQFAGAQADHYLVRLALEGDGLARQTADASFQFRLSAQDQEDLR